jgi:hypothetical protein
MRQCLRVLLAAILLLGPVSAASAATIQDLVKLKAAGLSDDILIALIESDGSVFQLKADDVISLKKQGLSEKVIMAMLVTATKRPAAPSATPLATRTQAAADMPVVRQPDPQVFTDPYQAESATQVVVPQPTSPVVINITQTVEQKVEAPTERQYSPMYATWPVYYVGAPVVVRPTTLPKEPIYWGFGAQRRPGTWKDKD